MPKLLQEQEDAAKRWGDGGTVGERFQCAVTPLRSL
jgi:hypothetical protein